MATDIQDIRESVGDAKEAWREIHDEGETDMAYVAGQPFSADDLAERKNRPTIAPDELSQYFNQVINALRANPRGMKFDPTGNGASEKGAEFYQNKAREVEYRSHGAVAYLIAAENAIQRSYGYLRVETRYVTDRSANQELWIEAFPDPDMVLPDPEATRADSSDMKTCEVLEWSLESEHKEQHAKARNRPAGGRSDDFLWNAAAPAWIQGKKRLTVEHWVIETTPRKLLLVQPPVPRVPFMQRMGMQAQPPMQPPPAPVQVFDDELDELPRGATVIRELRTVDFPVVKTYLADGLDILNEATWPGKYIPIVSCYGKILYVPEGGEVKKKLLSMTRFMRAPWKAYCYACSQELEILGQVPKASVLAAAGQLAGYETDWEDSYHTPKPFLLFHARTDEGGQELLPPPSRLAYMQGENLQAIEQVKEGFRRAIQAAAGSNFLPTDAQRLNNKSGTALEKIDQAATQGSYHFVKSYEDMIRQTGIIFEDLCDKIYDYTGDTGVIDNLGKASTIRINDPADPKSISTTGDYLVTVSSAPSSDSERQAAAEFTDTLVGNIQMIAQLSGPAAATKILAQSIRMRNLGPQGEALAEIISPTPPEGQQQPTPQEQQLQQQVQQLTQQLQKAGMVIQTKQVEVQGKKDIVQMQEQGETLRDQAANEVKIAVAEIAAQAKQSLLDMQLFYEERARLGIQQHEIAHDAADAAHELRMTGHDHGHAAALAVHAAATEAASQGRDHAHEAAQAVQAAQLAPTPDPSQNGDGA